MFDSEGAYVAASSAAVTRSETTRKFEVARHPEVALEHLQRAFAAAQTAERSYLLR